MSQGQNSLRFWHWQDASQESIGRNHVIECLRASAIWLNPLRRLRHKLLRACNSERNPHHRTRNRNALVEYTRMLFTQRNYFGLGARVVWEPFIYPIAGARKIPRLPLLCEAAPQGLRSGAARAAREAAPQGLLPRLPPLCKGCFLGCLSHRLRPLTCGLLHGPGAVLRACPSTDATSTLARVHSVINSLDPPRAPFLRYVKNYAIMHVMPCAYNFPMGLAPPQLLLRRLAHGVHLRRRLLQRDKQSSRNIRSKATFTHTPEAKPRYQPLGSLCLSNQSRQASISAFMAFKIATLHAERTRARVFCTLLARLPVRACARQ